MNIKIFIHLLKNKWIIVSCMLILTSCNSKNSKIQDKIITWKIYNVIENKKYYIGDLQQNITQKEVSTYLKNNLYEDYRFPNDTLLIKKIKYNMFDSLFVFNTNNNAKKPISLKDTTGLRSKFSPFMDYFFFDKVHYIILYHDMFIGNYFFYVNISLDNQIGVYEFMLSEEGILFVLEDVSYINKNYNKYIKQYTSSLSQCDTCQFNFDTNKVK